MQKLLVFARVSFSMVETGGKAGDYKVSRLIEKYGLGGIEAELVDRWTAEGPDRLSLRELAAYFNKRILDSALRDVERQPLDGERENLYRLLVGDDVSDAERTRTRRQLEQDGVEVDELLADFVSYQAIRTYLQEERGVEYSRPDDDQVEKEIAAIQKFRGKLESVTESKLDHLENTDEIASGSPHVYVNVSVVCEDCGEQYPISEFLDRGGCSCE